MARRDQHGRLRHEQGAPSSQGGRWAQETTPGAAATLTFDDTVAVDELRRRVRLDVRSRFGDSVDADDVIGIMHEKAATYLASGKWENLRDNLGMMRQTARSAAVDLAFPGQQNGRTRKAVQTLMSRVQAFEQAQQRRPSDAEFDQLADEVRDAMPGGQRPTKGYQRTAFPQHDVRLDAPLSDGELTLADAIEAPERAGLTGWEQLAAHRESQFGQRGLTDQQVKDRLWAVARQSDPNIPAPVRLTPKQAAATADAFDELDVHAVLRDYDYDGAATAGFDTIMAPFGGVEATTDAQQAAVVDTLSRNPSYASHLWRLAFEQARKSR